MPIKRVSRARRADSDEGDSKLRSSTPEKRVRKRVEKEPTPSDEASEEEAYEVEAILSSKFTKSQGVVYWIKWKGYDKEEDNTWEPEEALDGAQELLEAFKLDHAEELAAKTTESKKKPRPRASEPIPRKSASERPKKRDSEPTTAVQAKTTKRARKVVMESDQSDQSEDETSAVKKFTKAAKKREPASNGKRKIDSNGTRGDAKKPRTKAPPQDPDEDLVFALEEDGPVEMEDYRDVSWRKKYEREKSWDKYIHDVLTVEKKGQNEDEGVYAQVVWQDGDGLTERWILTREATDRFPHKLVAFYEKHLTFTNQHESTAEDEEEEADTLVDRAVRRATNLESE